MSSVARESMKQQNADACGTDSMPAGIFDGQPASGSQVKHQNFSRPAVRYLQPIF